MLGALFAVLSTAAFALNGASIRRGVLTGSVTQAMAITVPMGVPLFFVVALTTGSLGALFGFTATQIVLLALAGILHFVWGRYCNYRATKAVGSNASIPLQQFDFPLKLALAIVFLGETLSPLGIIGIGLILLGGSIAVVPKSKRGRKKSVVAIKAVSAAVPQSVGAAAAAVADAAPAPAAAVFVPNYFEGYLFAALSITGYGVSPLLIRITLQDAGLGASIAGGLVSYIAATSVIGALLFLPGRFAHVMAMNTVSARWFVASSLFVGVSHIFRYMAFSIAPITVVAPVMRAAGLLRIVFNWLINREYEIFEPRLIAGICVSVVGGVVLAISPELVRAYVPLPEALGPLLDWRWP